MPGRKIPLVTGELYHVFNRGVAHMPTFTDRRTYRRAISLMSYYQNLHIPLKYSHLMTLARYKRQKILHTIRDKHRFLVDIICYCLMPNHFHFLLRQNVDSGISKFLADFTNSYTRYFNTRDERVGPLFQGKFKAVHIDTEAQLLHLSRYVHLNPFTSHIVKFSGELKDYEFSSFPDYLGKRKSDLVHQAKVMTSFNNPEAYKEFVFNNADYQRRLHEIKHLVLE